MTNNFDYIFHERILLDEIIAVMDEAFTDLIMFYTQFRITLVIQKLFQSLNDFQESRLEPYDSVKMYRMCTSHGFVKVKEGLEYYQCFAKKRKNESMNCSTYQ